MFVINTDYFTEISFLSKRGFEKHILSGACPLPETHIFSSLPKAGLFCQKQICSNMN